MRRTLILTLQLISDSNKIKDVPEADSLFPHSTDCHLFIQGANNTCEILSDAIKVHDHKLILMMNKNGSEFIHFDHLCIEH
ncbi:unnamed protein product [Brugia pahangi]|uniref:Uncharacterized protein n=1 Tax=Brugia pahangi TaxID=6280 RepID=A0A0N4T5B0_BRUPA|nr:unnamed protein product [Brugia pahangi]